MPEWTKEQKSAIDIRDCDLLVSAAAGSGKTAVLSQRVLEKITDDNNPVSVDKLLIVTFTEAAAAEMRQRIIDKIRGKLEENPDNIFLSKQLALVPKANITTIHSFCLSIIKNNFHLLDIDPSFGIFDEGEKELTFIKLINDTINEMYEKYGQDFSDMSNMFSGGNDEQLGEMIIFMYKYLQSFENPLGWLNEQTEKYNVTDFNLDSNNWTSTLKIKYRHILPECIDMIENALDYAEEGGVTNYIPFLNHDIDILSAFNASLSGSFEEMYNEAKKCSFESVRKNSDCDAELAKQSLELRNKAIKEVSAMAEEIILIFENSPENSLKKAYKYIKLLEETVIVFDTKYKDEKKKKNVLDFNDFEHIALNILSDESLPVASELKAKYEEIYVDEYQDCNGVQEAIFSSFSRKYNGKSCNMFMVGDIKQSIYKFRQADPSIFIGKLHTYNNYGTQQKIMLNKNFRSRREVVECINNLFSKIMTSHIGSVDYTEEEALNFGASYPETEFTAGGQPEILAVSDENYEEDVSKIVLESKMVAQKIKDMVGSFYVYDNDIKGYRPSCYRDFAILIRNPSGKIDDIELALKSENIPYFSDKGTGLFDSHEIEILSLALEIIDNPLQDIPLIGFMRSELCGFDENELVSVRRYKNGCYFYNALAECSKNDNELGNKCKKFLDRLFLWREYSKITSVSGLLGKIIDDTAFYAYIQTLPGGKNRRANVELFMEYAAQFDKGELKGVFSFVKYIEKLKGNKKGTETAKTLSESCDVVRIMSIHKSKGLEFPVVFLMNAGGKFIEKDWTASQIMLHKDLGVGFDYLDNEKKIKYPLVSKKAISYKLKLEGLSEEMRVLYVALTRAREKLFVTFTGNSNIKKLNRVFETENSGKITGYKVEKCHSFLDWILLGFWNDEKKPAWKVTVVDAGEIDSKTEIKTEVKETHSSKPDIYDKISKKLSFEYPFAEGTKLSAKYSVSELKNRFNSMSEQENILFKENEVLPKFMRGDAISSSKLGTIYHLILRFVDFSMDDQQKSLDKCKEYLIENSFVTREELLLVNDDIILDFLSSDICKLMNSADILYREIPFNICINADELSPEYNSGDSVLLQGIIDCLFVIGERCFVLDYKTESKRNTKEELLKTYNEQLRLYKIAAEKITEKKMDMAYLYLLNRGELCPAEL